MAAALACGPGALLSHRSAATLLDLRPTAAGPIDVTIARGGGRRRRGIAIHTTRSLEAVDLGSADGIPCTSVARTLVDLAEVLSASDLSYALEQAGKQNLFDRNAIDELLTRLPGRRGARKLRRRLAKLDDEPRLLRSKLERKFLELVQRAGLPDPVVNGYVGRHEVDFHWPQQRLIFETDGRLTHANPSAFERDRQRDLELGLAGWTVERVSWTQVTRQSGQVTALLRRRLGIPPP
jgi:very-short-patch-repair endonuclease